MTMPSLFSISPHFPLSLFLRAVSSCFLVAFLSIYPQINGLYGPNGLMPIDPDLKDTVFFDRGAVGSGNVLAFLASVKGRGVQQTAVFLGLSPALAMEAVAIAGAVVAAIVTLCPVLLNKPAFAFLWYGYLSLFSHGQTFLWFQWDTLLLEVGFLCVVVAPFFVCRDGIHQFYAWVGIHQYLSGAFICRKDWSKLR
jgi:hypothetical protein